MYGGLMVSAMLLAHPLCAAHELSCTSSGLWTIRCNLLLPSPLIQRIFSLNLCALRLGTNHYTSFGTFAFKVEMSLLVKRNAKIVCLLSKNAKMPTAC